MRTKEVYLVFRAIGGVRHYSETRGDSVVIVLVLVADIGEPEEMSLFRSLPLLLRSGDDVDSAHDASIKSISIRSRKRDELREM